MALIGCWGGEKAKPLKVCHHPWFHPLSALSFFASASFSSFHNHELKNFFMFFLGIIIRTLISRSCFVCAVFSMQICLLLPLAEWWGHTPTEFVSECTSLHPADIFAVCCSTTFLPWCPWQLVFLLRLLLILRLVCTRPYPDHRSQPNPDYKPDNKKTSLHTQTALQSSDDQPKCLHCPKMSSKLV